MNNEPVASTKPDQSVLSDDFLIEVFARLDPLAFALALGVFMGASLWAATAILLVKSGVAVGQNLVLLNQFIPGYTVSWTGSLVGAAEGFVAGFVVGGIAAVLRNLLVRTWMYACAFWTRLDRFLDDI